MAALIEAVERDEYNEAKILIKNGANINYVREKEDTYTALYVAAAKGATQLVYILLHHGADVNFSTRSHNTVLHAAAGRGCPVTVRIILSYGAYINAANDNLDTALHTSAYRGNAQVCSLLLSMGADMSSVNLRGKTPFDIARSRRHVDAVLAFKRHIQNATQADRGCHTQELYPQRCHQLAKNNSSHTAPLTSDQNFPPSDVVTTARTSSVPTRRLQQRPQQKIICDRNGVPVNVEYSPSRKRCNSPEQFVDTSDGTGVRTAGCTPDLANHMTYSVATDPTSVVMPYEEAVLRVNFQKDGSARNREERTAASQGEVLSDGLSLETIRPFPGSHCLPTNGKVSPSPVTGIRSDDWDLFGTRYNNDPPERNHLTENLALPWCYPNQSIHDLDDIGIGEILSGGSNPVSAPDSGARRKDVPAHTYENVVFSANAHGQNGAGACASDATSGLSPGDFGRVECDSSSVASWPRPLIDHSRESPRVAANGIIRNSTQAPNHGDILKLVLELSQKDPLIEQLRAENAELKHGGLSRTMAPELVADDDISELKEEIEKLVLELSQKDTLIEQLRAENAELKHGGLSRTMAPELVAVDDISELKEEIETRTEEVKKAQYRNERLLETNEAQQRVIEQLRRELQSLTMLVRSQIGSSPLTGETASKESQ